MDAVGRAGGRLTGARGWGAPTRRQALCNLELLRRRVAAGMLDLHIDDCHRALRRFAAAAAADHDAPGCGAGAGDPEWRCRLETLSVRLQEMVDFLVADRALLFRMPALVAQQAANRPTGSAPGIAGLFALERGQPSIGQQSQRAREAEAENNAGRQALARYRPPTGPVQESVDSASLLLVVQHQEACNAPLSDVVEEAAIRVEAGVAEISGSTGSDGGGVSGKGGGLSPDAQPAAPSASAAALAGSSVEVGQGEMTKSFEKRLPAGEGNTLPQGDMAALPLDPAPPWIEHVNKEELAAAIRRRERAGGVASSGTVTGIPRASFGHVALSSDEVRLVTISHVAFARPCLVATMIMISCCMRSVSFMLQV